jgi:hypothetical protein
MAKRTRHKPSAVRPREAEPEPTDETLALDVAEPSPAVDATWLEGLSDEKRARAIEAVESIPAPGWSEATIILDPLWVERLGKMAAEVHQTREEYLTTLVKRAWCAMPLAKRT